MLVEALGPPVWKSGAGFLLRLTVEHFLAAQEECNMPLKPFSVDDWPMLVASRALAFLHYQRSGLGSDADDGHGYGRPAACQTCRVLALGMVTAANRTFAGVERPEAIRKLKACSAKLSPYWLANALRTERAAAELPTRPERVARGTLVDTVLRSAHKAGRLDCDPETAEQLLELVIWSVQDATGSTEVGKMFPWNYFAARLSAEFDMRVTAAEVARWSHQIFTALESDRRTAVILDRNVLRHSALLSRRGVIPERDDDEFLGPVEAEVPITDRAPGWTDDYLNRLTLAAAQLLIRLGGQSAREAKEAARRAISDRVAADAVNLAELDELVSLVAKDAAIVAARHRAEAQARRALAELDEVTIADVRRELDLAFRADRNALPSVYRRAAGRSAYEQFLDRQARRLLRDLIRLGRGGRGIGLGFRHDGGDRRSVGER